MDMPDIMKRRQQEVEETSLESIEDLLSQLSEAEIADINSEFDAENALLPASERIRYHTDKQPSGQFNKQHLVNFLEEQAKNEKDWDTKVFIKETKGTVWKPKDEKEKLDLGGDANENTEWDEILKEASEEELVDLAAILGFHSYLNQVQYHSAMNNELPSETDGGFQGVAKSEKLKVLPSEPPNPTDVDESLDLIESNNPALNTLNLNNIMNISIEKLQRFGHALKTNTHLKVLLMANTKMGDAGAVAIAEGLSENSSLRILNLESNYITGEKIAQIVRAINTNQTLVEFRASNQKPSVLGNRTEMDICKLIEANNTILRLGLFFQFADARYKVQEQLKRNLDKLRTDRSGKTA